MTSLWLTIGLFSSLLAVLRVDAGAADRDLERLLKDEWEDRLRDDPLFATSVGDYRYNDRLPSVAPENQETRLDEARAFLKRLQSIDRGRLSEGARLNHDIFELTLKNRIAESEFHTHLMPVTARSGFHTSMPDLCDRIPLNTVKDYEDYISRLEGFRSYAREHIALMEEGMRRKVVPPSIVLEGYADSIRPHIVNDPKESRFFKAFEEMPDAISREKQEGLKERGKSAIDVSVVPAYRDLLEFLDTRYVSAARESIGASELPEGRDFYRHRVRKFTTLDIEPEEVHRIGQEEVRRIRKEMEAVIRKTGFEGTFPGFLKFLRNDKRFYVDTPDQLLKEVSFVLKKMDGELPRLFGRLPRMPYGIKPIPDYNAPRTTTAYYSEPAGDGSRAGTYYVNTYDLKSRPLYEIEALSLHEAVPGHHLQIALAHELEGMPNFRRFGGFTAFVEGWALYAERLGLEVGFFKDPYSDFGRLTYEMWRALRLAVDTGIHYLGWSRQQAIDFMAENSALTLHNITTEVDRYIAWPGQAIAYKMGELKIRELRKKTEEALGEGFDIRRFHDVALGSGAVPLGVLKANVSRWIETEKKRIRAAGKSPKKGQTSTSD